MTKVDKSTDINALLYAVDKVYKPIYDSFVEDFSNLPKDKQVAEKKWICERLYEIDNGKLDTQKYLSHPIRFWFNEYRHALATVFNSI